MWLLLCLAVLVHGHPSLEEDTTCTVPESEWYHAENHASSLLEFAMAWSGPRRLHVLDAFGASGNVRRQWEKSGFVGASFDVKISTDHDLVTERGAMNFLELGLSLVPKGLLMGGPPCSLFIGASSSVHLRHIWTPWGNPYNQKVRLANLIWSNVATLIRVLFLAGREILVVLEQPSQSYGFKLPCIDSLRGLGAWPWIVVLTYMGFYGHDLAKPSHLLGNLRTVGKLQRCLKQKDRLRFKARLEKRNQRRKVPREYHRKVVKPNGELGWQGGKSLPASAAYTAWFCRALFQVWLEQFNAPVSMACD